jgi:predicted secreted protein
MAITSALAVFFIIWWVTLFAVLPFGVRSQVEADAVVSGSDPGAPVLTRGLRVFTITTGIAVVLFGAFWAVYVLNVFDLAVINEIGRR